MPLTTLAAVRRVPGLQNVVKVTDAWLESLIAATDEAVKKWCKQEIELRAYTEYYSGNEMPDVVLRQYPVLSGTTQVAAGSNGAVLPQATIHVASTTGFDPSGRSDLPTISIQTGQNSWTTVTYTGVTSTSFTGCSGGTGTLSSQAGMNAVNQPVVYFDPCGYWGQAPQTQNGGPFAPGTIQVAGVNFAVQLNERGRVSKSGLLTRLGGVGGGYYFGGWPQNIGRNKLASWRKPCWQAGQGNIKVLYSAGYEVVPDDLSAACTSLVANLVRNQPKGAELSSEGLGAYSYSILTGSQDPEIGSVREVLTRYRDASW